MPVLIIKSNPIEYIKAYATVFSEKWSFGCTYMNAVR